MKHSSVFCLIMGILLLVACNGDNKNITPNADLEATLDVALKQTIAAQPTYTPSVTPQPSVTPTLSPTATFTPTFTSTSTETPTPTTTELNAGKNFFIETSEDGWTYYFYDEDGFSIGLPPKWQHLDLAADNLEEMLTYASENNEMLSDIYSSGYLRSMIAAGIKFIAVDAGVDSLSAGIPSSVNVLISDLLIDISLDDYVEISIQQLKSVFGEDTSIQNERIQLNGHEAERILYESDMADLFGNSHTVVHLQHIILDNRTQYILSIGSTKEVFDLNSDIYFDIVKSFKLSK